jgi:hypothetical protein
MCINKLCNYHILFTNMFRLLQQPSLGCHARIQTIYNNVQITAQYLVILYIKKKTAQNVQCIRKVTAHL